MMDSTNTLEDIHEVVVNLRYELVWVFGLMALIRRELVGQS
jgi:hypothetical protein